MECRLSKNRPATLLGKKTQQPLLTFCLGTRAAANVGTVGLPRHVHAKTAGVKCGGLHSTWGPGPGLFGEACITAHLARFLINETYNTVTIDSLLEGRAIG